MPHEFTAFDNQIVLPHSRAYEGIIIRRSEEMPWVLAFSGWQRDRAVEVHERYLDLGDFLKGLGITMEQCDKALGVDLDSKPCSCVTIIACGRTSVDELVESRYAALREGQETLGLFTGCGRVSSVLSLYRCLQCGRWMCSECLRRHFQTSKHDE